GHGCEEFEGMCCMNLSDHSKSIYRHLKELQKNYEKITYDDDPLETWLSS
ncbi:hypothetical protein N303_08616, partial [Cuculus canorus]